MHKVLDFESFTNCLNFSRVETFANRLNFCRVKTFINHLNFSQVKIFANHLNFPPGDIEVSAHWFIPHSQWCSVLRRQNPIWGKTDSGVVQKVVYDQIWSEISKVASLILIRFRIECPNGKMSRHKMKKLFEKAFPEGEYFFQFPEGDVLNSHNDHKTQLREQWNYLWFSGNATLITCHVFRIFDLDRNDFLDFKEFLLAIDVAMREIGAERQSTVFSCLR